VRLFIAIEIPADVRSALASFLQELRAIAPGVKWVRAENLHVTLKFLGHTDEAKLSAIEEVLDKVRSANPVNLEFRGLGFFPSEKRPRVFWADMEASATLKTLASDVDNATHEFGFPLEDRPFTPHLTLARFESPRIPPELSAAIVRNVARDFGSMTTTEFHLIESKLKPTGAEYTTLHTFPFAGAK